METATAEENRLRTELKTAQDQGYLTLGLAIKWINQLPLFSFRNKLSKTQVNEFLEKGTHASNAMIMSFTANPTIPDDKRLQHIKDIFNAVRMQPLHTDEFAPNMDNENGPE